MIHIDAGITPKALLPAVQRLFELSAAKILRLERTWDPTKGTPVFTVRGRYTSRGWTEWTQGFQFGAAFLQFDASSDDEFLELGKQRTIAHMATHVSHIGVHDHGFNNISTYGNWWRLMREGRIAPSEPDQRFLELALKVSGAVQAARWTTLPHGRGYIYSFNGPHSLFVDTIRSLRVLAVADQLGHVLMGERDRRISLLSRLILHAQSTAQYSVYYGDGRDAFDLPGRTAHESIFNLNDGSYRCPSSQQGYSPFSTWTRGLAWALLGFAELLEYLDVVSDAHIAEALAPGDDPAIASSLNAADVRSLFLRAARATARFYVQNTCADGIPMWDTGAPNLEKLGDYLNQPSNPFNEWEPVDSSAAAIAAQGLIRLGNYLIGSGDRKQGKEFKQAGLTAARTLFREPYLSIDPRHEGLLLHSVYHRPNGWDHIAKGQRIPNGESSMWGDYHARELALLILREATGQLYLTFFDFSKLGERASGAAGHLPVGFRRRARDL